MNQKDGMLVTGAGAGSSTMGSTAVVPLESREMLRHNSSLEAVTEDGVDDAELALDAERCFAFHKSQR